MGEEGTNQRRSAVLGSCSTGPSSQPQKLWRKRMFTPARHNQAVEPATSSRLRRRPRAGQPKNFGVNIRLRHARHNRAVEPTKGIRLANKTQCRPISQPQKHRVNIRLRQVRQNQAVEPTKGIRLANKTQGRPISQPKTLRKHTFTQTRNNRAVVPVKFIPPCSEDHRAYPGKTGKLANRETQSHKGDVYESRAEATVVNRCLRKIFNVSLAYS
jgi:hypothetical protein